MPLSESTLAELRDELNELLDDQQRIGARIQAIRNLLGDPTAFVAGSPEERISLKDTILSYLTKKPMRAAEVTAILRDYGFSVPGKTDLHHRVYNEMFRLMRTGVLRRLDTGEFEIVKDQG
jgi:hypothetical protein